MSGDLRKYTYFLSDLHLGAHHIGDDHGRQRRVAAFLRRIAPTAKTIYLVGDVLDYWFEYRTVVPRGFVRFFGALAELADSGVKIVWITGNHDIWLFDYLRTELGIEVVDPADGGIVRTIDDVRFFIAHGDGVGRQPGAYRLLRALFHNRLCQKLYSAIHPRWTVPLAHAWSSHSGKLNRVPAELSPRARTSVEVFARELSTRDPELRYIILGHHHVALDEPVNSHCRLVILGEWIERCSYAVFDGENLTLKSED